MCGPMGRDCIEKNFAETFGCNVTCTGIYADIQWTDEPLMEEDTFVRHKVSKGKRAIQRKDMVRIKMLRLISEYKAFKRDIVKHFRFDASSDTSFFGR